MLTSPQQAQEADSTTLDDLCHGQESTRIPLICGTVGRHHLLGTFHKWTPHAIAHTSFLDEQLTPPDPAVSPSLLDNDSPDSDYGDAGCSCHSIEAPVAHDSTRVVLACTAQSNCDCVAEYGNFYDDRGKLLLDALPPRHALVECSSLCGCRRVSIDECVTTPREPKRRRMASQESMGNKVRQRTVCANQVTAKGISVKVQIRPTALAGLGVFAVEAIQRGTFVCEYAGEIISDREAAARWKQYAASGIGNYILCLREWHHEQDRRELRTNIDATRLGNLGRFLNHMCPPLTNLVVLPVRGGAAIANLPNDATVVPPRAAIFAARDIRPGEQLGYDYAEAGGCSVQPSVGSVFPPPHDERGAPLGEQLPLALSNVSRAETRMSRSDDELRPGQDRKDLARSSENRSDLPLRGTPCNLEDPSTCTLHHAAIPLEKSAPLEANIQDGISGHDEQIGSAASRCNEETASIGSSQAADSHPDAPSFAEIHSGVQVRAAIGQAHDARFLLGNTKENVKMVDTTESKEADAPILPDLLQHAPEARTECRCGSSECRGWLPFSVDLT